jgi:hypothetical protein
MTAANVYHDLGHHVAKFDRLYLALELIACTEFHRLPP